jgi:hypothetical protein
MDESEETKVMTTTALARGVHFTGSFPAADAEAAFRTISGALGDRLRRIPDGETGRPGFVITQTSVFAGHPDFTATQAPHHPVFADMTVYTPRDGVDASTLRFDHGALGYARDARDSYDIFRRLKAEQVIPERVRFQVSLPTPGTVLSIVLAPSAVPLVEPAYEAALLAEVDEIIEMVPADELAIQWDAPTEVHILSGVTSMEPWWTDVRAGVVERLGRLGSRVPAPVELGYHLCFHSADPLMAKEYGLPEGMRIERNSTLPDASLWADLIPELCAKVDRSMNFIHLPVPRSVDDDYLAPLGQVELPPGLDLYLGLAYYADGVEGTRRRLETAQRAVREFGVSTPCGWGPRRPETIPPLLDILKQVSAPVAPEGQGA